MHDMETIAEQTVALQIRDFPVGLGRRLRAIAALKGCTTREVFVAAVERYLPDAEKQAVQELKEPGRDGTQADT